MGPRLRKLVGYVFPVLLISAFLTLFSNVSGEGTLSPQDKAETLLAIVEKANETVVGIYNSLRDKEIQIPLEALVLYEEGLARATESFSLYESGSYEEACEVAVEALKRFRGALEAVYSVIRESSTQAELVGEAVTRLNNSITRGFRYLEYIESLVNTLELSGYDTGAVEGKVWLARWLLERALIELSQHRFKSTGITLLIARNVLSALTEYLKTAALDLKIARLESYIVDAYERLDLLKVKIASLSSELPPEDKDASLAAVQEAEDSLDNARSYLDVQMVNEVVEELVQSRESEEEALRIISKNQTSSDTLNMGPYS